MGAFEKVSVTCRGGDTSESWSRPAPKPMLLSHSNFQDAPSAIPSLHLPPSLFSPRDHNLEMRTSSAPHTCVADGDVVWGKGSALPETQGTWVIRVWSRGHFVIPPVLLASDQVCLAIERPREHSIHFFSRGQPKLYQWPRCTLKLSFLEHPELRAWKKARW